MLFFSIGGDLIEKGREIYHIVIVSYDDWFVYKYIICVDISVREIDRRRESDEEREIRGTSIIVKAQRGRERERERAESREEQL